MNDSGATALPTDTPAPPIATRAVRTLALLGVGGLLLWLGSVSAQRIDGQHPDFEYFYKAGAWLAEHGTLDPGYDVVDGEITPRGRLDWYLPFVSRLMTLPGSLPFHVAGYLWLTINLVALLAVLVMLGRYVSGLPPQDWPVTQLLPVILMGAYWLWEFRLNQINVLTLLLIVGSFVCWLRGRPGTAGFWLGLAVLLKLTPALLVIWFALKRQFRTVGIALLTIVLAGPVADIAALGPDLAISANRTWLSNATTSGSHRGLILSQREMDWRNQGLGAVLSRWLHPTNYNTRFSNDPRHRAAYDQPEDRHLNVAELSRPAVARLTMIAVGISVLLLFWIARRPASQLTVWEIRLEWTLFVLAMLWLMPVMRRYHMVWALPALSVLATAVHYTPRRRTWRVLALACISLAAAAQFSMWSMRAEAMGLLLASVLVLALPVFTLLLTLRRDRNAWPLPYYAREHPAPAEAND